MIKMIKLAVKHNIALWIPMLCENSHFSQRPQFCCKGFVPHKLISMLVGFEIWGESHWCQGASSPSGLVSGGSTGVRCWTGLGRAGRSGWSSCRVITLSHFVPSAQQGQQVPLTPVTKHTAIWHQCQQLRAIKTGHMIPIYFIPY